MNNWLMALAIVFYAVVLPGLLGGCMSQPEQPTKDCEQQTEVTASRG